MTPLSAHLQREMALGAPRSNSNKRQRCANRGFSSHEHFFPSQPCLPAASSRFLRLTPCGSAAALFSGRLQPALLGHNSQEAARALDGLRSRQLQERACQTTGRKSKFIENREVVCLYDRNQVAWKMSLSPVSMEITTASDHRT